MDPSQRLTMSGGIGFGTYGVVKDMFRLTFKLSVSQRLLSFMRVFYKPKYAFN